MSDEHQVQVRRTNQPKREQQQKPKKGREFKLSTIIFTLAFVVVSIAAIWFFTQYNKEKNANSLDAIAQREEENRDSNQALVEQLGKHIILPDDEEPLIATVTNTDDFEDQEFYKGVEEGDVLFVYVDAKKAILFSPSRDIIRNVGAINPNDSLQSGQ